MNIIYTYEYNPNVGWYIYLHLGKFIGKLLVSLASMEPVDSLRSPEQKKYSNVIQKHSSLRFHPVEYDGIAGDQHFRTCNLINCACGKGAVLRPVHRNEPCLGSQQCYSHSDLDWTLHSHGVLASEYAISLFGIARYV